MRINRRQLRYLIREFGEANISHIVNFERDTGTFKQYAEEILDVIDDHYKNDKNNPTKISLMTDKWRGMTTDNIAKGMVDAFAKSLGYGNRKGAAGAGLKMPDWHHKDPEEADIIPFPGGRNKEPERLAAGKIMRITKGQLRGIIKEATGSDMPDGNVIGYIEANIDNDYRYNQKLSVIHNPDTDETTIIVQDAGAVGGMDYQGPDEGRSTYHTTGRQSLPAGANGKDLAAAIKTLIQRKADTIKQYGKPSKNFTWGESMHASGPKGLNVQLATAALRKSRGLKEGTGMRITKRQLYRIIREAMDVVNAESGEVFEFGEDGLPDEAWPDLQKRLGLKASRHSDGYFEVSDDDFHKLEDEVEGKKGRRKSAADAKRLDPEALLDRLDQWAQDAGSDYAADNPGVELEQVARDLAASAEYSFEPDEWEELVAHFDFDEETLVNYAADAIVG